MSPTTGWLIMGSWFVLSLVIGILLGRFLEDEE
jgi:uncharacterized protein YneF (UPF0154 family)